MDGMNIVGQLEELGFTLKLAIDCEHPGEPSPEAETLLSRLADERDAAIDYLIAGRFVLLPDDYPIPAEWSINGKMKRYILDAPGEILGAIAEGHSPLFALLWAVKALCFISGGKAQYERIEAAICEKYCFDFTQYSEDWKRYSALMDTPPEDTPALLSEFLDVQKRLRELGARI